MNQCKNCTYWALGHTRFDVHGHPFDVSVADCRLHAPVRIERDATTGQSTAWPQTAQDDWCGEYAPDAETVTRTEAERMRVMVDADKIRAIMEGRA